jgi:hypothetical protein
MILETFSRQSRHKGPSGAFVGVRRMEREEEEYAID